MTDDPRITGGVDFLSFPFEGEDARRIIAGNGDGRDCYWGVWLKDKPEMIGVVGTHQRGSDEIEIGYWFAPHMHGHGFAKEAVSAIVAALSNAYPGRPIFAECRPENAASWRLLEKAGFRPDGSDGLRPGRKRLTLASD